MISKFDHTAGSRRKTPYYKSTCEFKGGGDLRCRNRLFQHPFRFPVAFTTIELVTGDTAVVQAGAANLDAAVDQPGCRIAGAFDFQREIKVCVAFFCADEFVFRKIFRVETGRYGSVFHPPDSAGQEKCRVAKCTLYTFALYRVHSWTVQII